MDEPKIIDVEVIQDGMKAADDIIGLDGAVIIHKGMEVESRHMSLLKHSHITHVRVFPPDKERNLLDQVHINDFPDHLTLLENARVLVVDDSKFLRFKLGKCLQEAGLNVVGMAGDGNEAVEAVNKLKPNVVTLDIEMPECDGLRALAKLKPVMPESVFIMVSSVGEDEKILEALANGAIDFISKPIDPIKTARSIINAIIIDRGV